MLNIIKKPKSQQPPYDISYIGESSFGAVYIHESTARGVAGWISRRWLDTIFYSNEILL